MAAVRTSRAPRVRTSGRAPPVDCPSPRVPQVENVGSKPAVGNRRKTMRRSASFNVLAAVPPAAGAAGARSTLDVTTSTTPRLAVALRELMSAPVEAGDTFVLSRIDGRLNVEDLTDLTGLPERVVMQTLERLARLGLITLG